MARPSFRPSARPLSRAWLMTAATPNSATGTHGPRRAPGRACGLLLPGPDDDLRRWARAGAPAVGNGCQGRGFTLMDAGREIKLDILRAGHRCTPSRITVVPRGYEFPR